MSKTSRLEKSSSEKVLFGVCGGLGNYLGIDPVLVRLLFILGAIFSGSILFWIYLIMALILPKQSA